MYGLNDELIQQIIGVARRFEASGLTLFGSRAQEAVVKYNRTQSPVVCDGAILFLEVL